MINSHLSLSQVTPSSPLFLLLSRSSLPFLLLHVFLSSPILYPSVCITLYPLFPFSLLPFHFSPLSLPVPLLLLSAPFIFHVCSFTLSYVISWQFVDIFTDLPRMHTPFLITIFSFQDSFFSASNLFFISCIIERSLICPLLCVHTSFIVLPFTLYLHRLFSFFIHFFFTPPPRNSHAALPFFFLRASIIPSVSPLFLDTFFSLHFPPTLQLRPPPSCSSSFPNQFFSPPSSYLSPQ